MSETKPGIFLRAQWRFLAMINFPVDKEVVQPYVPRGTELDCWQGQTFLSLVGFRFLRTRVLGCALPFHRNFDEVNLRFYVRRSVGVEWRRGVVFIKEIVPRRLIAWAARRFYNENYLALPMRSRCELPELAYEWFLQGRWNGLKVQVAGNPFHPPEHSEEKFITEHYYGYAAQKDGSTVEYQVEHPSWRVWNGLQASLDCDIAAMYGAKFVPALSQPPSSAFVADGSEVVVRKGQTL